MAGILAFSDELFDGFSSQYVIHRRLFEKRPNYETYHNDYHLLVPGEYIAIVASDMVGNADLSRLAHGIYIIAKVISAQKKHFYDYGKAVLEFQDGPPGTIDGGSNGCDILYKYFPKDYNFACFQAFSFNDRAHLLKCMEMRPKIIAEQKRLEKEIKLEENERKRRKEETFRKRNDSVSDDDLSRAFRGETATTKFEFLKCPKCGTNLRVPLGKGQIEVKCPKCGFTFITRT